MSPELISVQAKLQKVYDDQRANVVALTAPQLDELIHRSEEIRLNTSHGYLLRVSAEINRAAATLELERRNEKPTRPTSPNTTGGS